MYIIELFFKIIEDCRAGKFKKKPKILPELEICDHTFFPIDSTGKILACSKCGLIHKISDENSNQKEVAPESANETTQKMPAQEISQSQAAQEKTAPRFAENFGEDAQ